MHKLHQLLFLYIGSLALVWHYVIRYCCDLKQLLCPQVEKSYQVKSVHIFLKPFLFS